MDLKRVGGEARPATEGPDHAPRIAASRGLVLPGGQHPAPLGMRERRVVEVLAHVILVEPHRAVMRRGPGPGRRSGPPSRRPRPVFSSITCQNQAAADSASVSTTANRMPCHSPDQRHALPVGSGASGAPRTQQRNRFDGVADASEVDVGGSAFDLVAGEQVEEDVAVVEPAERAVGVQLDGESRGALEAEGGGGAWSVFIVWLCRLAGVSPLSGS